MLFNLIVGNIPENSLEMISYLHMSDTNVSHLWYGSELQGCEKQNVSLVWLRRILKVNQSRIADFNELPFDT